MEKTCPQLNLSLSGWKVSTETACCRDKPSLILSQELMVVCQKNVNFNKLNLVMLVLSVDNKEVWLVQPHHVL